MLEFDILTLALLFGAAFLGGFIDSIAGGGGSILSTTHFHMLAYL